MASASVRSRRDHHLDRLTLHHGAISIRDRLEIDDTIEHAAGLNATLENVGKQLLDVRTHRSRTAADGNVCKERLLRRRNRVVVRNTDTAYRTAWPHDAHRGLHRR